MSIKDLSMFGGMNIEQLQVCILVECKEMRAIVDVRHSSVFEDIFPRLLMLSVSYMKNLRSICEGRVHSKHCFGMLKTLELHNCPKLTTIFTLDFLGNLSLLKVLLVKDCPKISALISCGSFELRVGTFLPKLRTMTLLHLPELISISSRLHIGPSLENMGVYDCPKLQTLSKKELSSHHLKVIKGETKWWEALTWSEAEWGVVGRPSIFDCIFSPIDKQVDIMSQLELDDNIDDIPVDQPLQSSTGKISEDMGCIKTGGIVCEPLQSSRVKAFKYRKRTMEIRTIISETFEDGTSWRKYGQKEILNAKFPRCNLFQFSMNHTNVVYFTSIYDLFLVNYMEASLDLCYMWSIRRKYFRCTHKFDEGCQATKQVQKIDQNTSLYRITYFGNHTCTQASSVTVSSMNNQVDVMTQFGVDDIDDTPVDEPLRPSNAEVIKDKKHSPTRRAMPRWTLKSKDLADGYSWRKYGQKDVLGAKFPRGYYRCSRRNTEGCLATKVLERDDEDPSLFNITYRGRHTCRQASSATNSSFNNQADLMTQTEVADDDDDNIYYHPALRPSSGRIFADQKPVTDISSGESDARTLASCVTNSTPSFSGNQWGKSASDSDLEAFPLMGFWNLDSSLDTEQLSGVVEFDENVFIDFTKG
ncbi:uncharacterized protein LOC129285665 [Prosopis cineraria]|uniref:uncharacterized protein LOC129285665 n=1 Tax=Prosopis cineraria TaxID=364024 RepID=UPI00240F9193|nr:uncharacterized protein LOC129285665 [Prosopis cineraria]